TFERDHEIGLLAGPWRVTELGVPEEHHSVRPPILDDVRKDVGVHEDTPRLAGANFSPLPPSVADSEYGFAGIHTDAEELKFKDGSDFGMRRRKVAFEAEAALADAGKPVPIVAELQRKRRQFGWPDHIEPQWIDCAGVIPRVQHGKAVD